MRVSARTREIVSAKAFLAKWLTADISPAPTCSELWAFYVADHVERKCASTEEHFYAWKQLEPRFGALKPIAVTPEVVDQHLKARRPSTCFVELRLLAACWRHGVKRGKLAPADLPVIGNLNLPSPPPRRERWLREFEVERLQEAAAEMRQGPRLSRIERFIWLALETGARRHAILELTWRQVDFDTRIIHFNPEGRRQTSKKRASVPISNDLMRILERAYGERVNEWVLDRPNRVHDLLDRVAARAGVEGVTAHVFRHTAATLMARSGMPLWKIAKVLGNTQEEVDETYAKHLPDDLRDCVNAIGARLKKRKF